MITPTESMGATGTPDADSLRIAALGAVLRKGRPVTLEVRALAQRLAEVWTRGGDPVQVLGTLYALGLAADDVLPMDDDELALVVELGRSADAP